tara:strand:- start:577 stop:807 length:231 start_codon:yes stop_codon:yes gene_type:complete
MKCMEKCHSTQRNCEQKECRMWINYKEDLNCALLATNKHKEMTLREVAERLGISIVRVKQIQDAALNKIKKFNLHL